MRRLAALLILLAASPAAADPNPSEHGPPEQRPSGQPPADQRPPDQRQTVIDLAYVLGESHALHRACAGDQDNTWRARMARLVQAEEADAPYKQRLTESFNAGFVAGHAEFPTCTIKSQAAERSAAERGRRLARRLATP